LLIVNWAAPTPGCTANFPENRSSQPFILRPFGRSGQELHVEYQVEPHFISFSVSISKKGYRQGPGSRNIEESLVKATTVPIQKSYKNHIEKTIFLCVHPMLVSRPDLDLSQDLRKVSQGIFQKKN
jgi:hypothetical protein